MSLLDSYWVVHPFKTVSIERGCFKDFESLVLTYLICINTNQIVKVISIQHIQQNNKIMHMLHIISTFV